MDVLDWLALFLVALLWFDVAVWAETLHAALVRRERRREAGKAW